MTKILEAEKSPDNSSSKETKVVSKPTKKTKIRTRSYSVNNNRIIKKLQKNSKKKSRSKSTSF